MKKFLSAFKKDRKNFKPFRWLHKIKKLIFFGLLITLGLSFLIGLLILILNPELILTYDARLRGISLKNLTEAEQIGQLNEYRKTAIQLLGGTVIAIGLYLTWRRIRAMERTVFVTEEGQITDRFSKAVEQLGNKESIAVRLGGIYALERIAKDSEVDHWTVIEVLSAYIREHANSISKPFEGSKQVNHSDEVGIVRHVFTDVHAAFTVITRRNVAFDPYVNLTYLNGAILEKVLADGVKLNYINLSEANLKKSKFNGAYIQSCDFSNANFEEAILDSTELKHAYFYRANLAQTNCQNTFFLDVNLSESNLTGACFFQAKLISVSFRDANLEDASFHHASLSYVDFKGANLQGADLSEANLEGAENLTIAQLKSAKSVKGAKLDDTLSKAFNETL